MQAMKDLKLSFIFFFVPLFSFCQNRPFEIFGTLTGNYDGKVYLFFEGKVRVRERISAEIKDGKFYFKGTAPMPILAKVALDNSLICDFYIDNSRTYLKCATNMQVYNQGQDTLNLLSLISVSGSGTDKLKSDFESYLKKLNKSKLSDEGKREAYYKKLSVLIRNHPKNKVSPYLLGKASTLSYSQVKQLSTLIDTSLNKTFEAKGVTSLLNELDKSKNSAIGVAFKDVLLKDSSGHEVDTKQFRGKYTLIVFWASWCKPCRAEHPDLNILYSRYKDKGFDMVGISLEENKEKWKKAVVKDQLHWIQLIDPNAFEGEVARYYGIEAIPVNLLLDKTGKIIGVSLTTKEIEATIEKTY
jgi:thiol-disulfide isomerase/thioredoxin